MNDTYNVNLVKDPMIGSHKTGSISRIDYDDIVTVLGLPNVQDDFDKVRWSWGFRVLPENTPMAIWDWKGSSNMQEWSIYGDPKLWAKLFPTAKIS